MKIIDYNSHLTTSLSTMPSMRILSRSGLLLRCRATFARPRTILILLLHLLSHGVYYALEAAHWHRLFLHQ